MDQNEATHCMQTTWIQHQPCNQQAINIHMNCMAKNECGLSCLLDLSQLSIPGQEAI